MRVNLLNPLPPVVFGGVTIARSEARLIVRLIAPAIALFVVVTAVSLVRLVPALLAFNSARATLAVEIRKIQYDPVRKEALQARSERLSDVASALDGERGAFARTVAPMVAMTNASPVSSRLARASVIGSTISVDSESRSYAAVNAAQQALTTSGFAVTVKTTAYSNDLVTWSAIIGAAP